MLLLVISLLALVVGPLLFRLADRAQWAVQALDGFIMISVAGLVLLHVVPHSVEVAGAWALGVALIGFVGPGLIESYLHRAARSTHLATMVLACIGLVVHEFFDGVALGLPAAGHEHHATGHEHYDEGSLLAMAVVLHRLPVAVTVWWLLRPVLGVAAAALTLGGLGLATVAGFAFAGTVAPWMDEAWIGFLQCLVAGSLLHVVVHRPPPLAASAPQPGPASAARGNLHAGLGALLGVLALAAISDDHAPLHGAGETVLVLALRSAPALLLGVLLAGLIKAYLPQPWPSWLRGARVEAAALRGVAFGVGAPVRPGGVVPLYRALIQSGVPAAAAMAFLVAAPALSVEAIALSLPLLGVELTVARVLGVVLVAAWIGVGFGRLSRTGAAPASEPAPAATRAGHGPRLRLAARLTLGVIDDVGPWLLFGLAAAALLEPLVDGPWLAALPWGTDVLVFTLLGAPLYVSAAGATPVAAMLVYQGVSPGAAVALLLVGPGVHLTVARALARVHGRRVAIAFAAAVAGLAAVAGWCTNLVIGPASGPAGRDAVAAEPGALVIACLAALGVLLALSLLRLGPRGFVGQVLPSHAHEDECPAGCSEHSHDHAH